MWAFLASFFVMVWTTVDWHGNWRACWNKFTGKTTDNWIPLVRHTALLFTALCKATSASNYKFQEIWLATIENELIFWYVHILVRCTSVNDSVIKFRQYQLIVMISMGFFWCNLYSITPEVTLLLFPVNSKYKLNQKKPMHENHHVTQ